MNNAKLLISKVIPVANAAGNFVRIEQVPLL